MLVTKTQIQYHAAPYGLIAIIPAGIPVTAAITLPEKNKFWVGTWPGMSEKAKSWQTSYGFLVDASEVEESPFQLGQRVRILPCPYYPGSIRYGVIHGVTQQPGMNLIDKARPSRAGEWSYAVANYYNPGAGALWFSTDGLQAMKRLPRLTDNPQWCYAKA